VYLSPVRDRVVRGAYILSALAAFALYPVLPSIGRKAALLIIAAATFLAVVVGLRRAAHLHRLSRILILAGLASVFVSTALFPDGPPGALVRIIDVAGYLLLLSAAMVLVFGHGRNNLGVVIDTAIAALAAGGVLWTLVLRPHLPASSTQGLARLGLLIIILSLLATLGAVVQLDRIGPTSALAQLIAAVLFALGGNVALAIDPQQVPVANAGMCFIAAYLALGLFGLNPKAQALFVAAPARPERLSVLRLVLLGLAIAITPTLLGAQLLVSGDRDGLLLLVSSVTVTVLVVARIAQLSGQRDHAERALKHQATHDPLTGLPNRREFHAQLDRLTRGGQRPAILFCDLDRFKAVNDRYGHAGGDELLSQVAQRLRDNVRTEDIVCRYGGDEFVILLPDIAPPELERTGQRIDLVLSQPFQLDGHEVMVGASIGAAVATSNRTPADLITLADHAMYDQKVHQRPWSVATGS
jgi:diguanylate cyclase